MPALNEEKNITDAIGNTLKAFQDYDIDGEIIVINDGSTDNTRGLIEEIAKNDSRISLINHDMPQGIGASFWNGVDQAKGDFLLMQPGDNEGDPWEILQYCKLLEYVDIVVPFVFNKEVRSLFRNALSFIYRFIINSTFLVYFNYTNGAIIYRISIFNDITSRSTGFFFQTDILIRTVKKGYLFAEVPYKLGKRSAGISKGRYISLVCQCCKGISQIGKRYVF